MILFTADWHLKLGQKNVPKKWALNRYKLFFEQIYALEHKCELHIIGGDLFDRLPNMEELELYFSFIRKVGIPTIIYDGNHEATKKGKTFFSQLKQVSNDINPLITIVDEAQKFPEYDFGILPYADLHTKNIVDMFNFYEPLFTHVRGEIPPHVKPEVDLEIFSKFNEVFAGDLHAHSNTQKNIIYPGSPMTTSFHRNEVKTGYLIIDNKASTGIRWSWGWREFKLPQLIRKTVSDPAQMLPTEYNHTIYEIQGDIQDLANIKNSELLDKKVVVRNSEATLIIDKDMSIQEELVEYLQYILEIGPEKIPDILGTYNDYTTNSQMG